MGKESFFCLLSSLNPYFSSPGSRTAAGELRHSRQSSYYEWCATDPAPDAPTAGPLGEIAKRTATTATATDAAATTPTTTVTTTATTTDAAADASTTTTSPADAPEGDAAAAEWRNAGDAGADATSAAADAPGTGERYFVPLDYLPV